MIRTTLLKHRSISVSDFRCTAGPGEKPFTEQFQCHSVSYVRKGSFGCQSRGRSFELVTGSVLVDETAALFESVIGVAGVVPVIVMVMGTESGYTTAPSVHVTVKGAVVVLTAHVPCVLDAVTLLRALVWLGAVPIAVKVSVTVTPAPGAKPRLLT